MRSAGRLQVGWKSSTKKCSLTNLTYSTQELLCMAMLDHKYLCWQKRWA